MYLTSIFYKLQGHKWQDGTALYYILRSNTFDLTPLSALVYRHPLVVAAATYGTLFMQLAFPWLMWWRKAKPGLFLAIASMHVGIAIAMNLLWFSFIMIAADLLLFPDDMLRNAYRTVRALPHARASVSPPPFAGPSRYRPPFSTTFGSRHERFARRHAVDLAFVSLDGARHPALARAVLHRRGARVRSLRKPRLDGTHAGLARRGPSLHAVRDPRRTIFDGFGEWVFARALRGECPERDGGLYAFAAEKGIDVAMLREVSDLAITFADEYAARILESAPDVVGFTTTFSQNVPSLAVAERIKRLRPDVRIVFGGANCDGIQGVGLHRNFPFVDFTIRGEGEHSFPALLEALRDGTSVETIRGLCWRDDTGAPQVNPESGMIPFGAVPAPDYDGWIEQIDASPLRTELKPILVMETARGCWWGEKSHCTFCGLNGSTMTFRSKPPAQAQAEIMQACHSATSCST